MNSERITTAIGTWKAIGEPIAADVLQALAVIVLTPHIHAYLKTHDPMALQQAEKAITSACEAVTL
jgi:hypothetical protein